MLKFSGSSYLISDQIFVVVVGCCCSRQRYIQLGMLGNAQERLLQNQFGGSGSVRVCFFCLFCSRNKSTTETSGCCCLTRQRPSLRHVGQASCGITIIARKRGGLSLPEFGGARIGTRVRLLCYCVSSKREGEAPLVPPCRVGCGSPLTFLWCRARRLEPHPLGVCVTRKAEAELLHTISLSGHKIHATKGSRRC